MREGEREDGSGSGGRERGLRKGTRQERSEGKRRESKRAEEGGSNGARERIKGGAWVNGDRDGGKLQGRYPEEDTGQYTVYSAHNYLQRGPCP